MAVHILDDHPGPFIRGLRLARKWPVKKLAFNAGVAKSTIWAIETGKCTNIRAIGAVLAALDYDLAAVRRLP